MDDVSPLCLRSDGTRPLRNRAQKPPCPAGIGGFLVADKRAASSAALLQPALGVFKSALLPLAAQKGPGA
jgi:hypothetical protein